VTTLSDEQQAPVSEEASFVNLDLGPVAVPKAAEVFASVLRGKILSGEIPQGSTLPPERTLVDQSQLSRATVREALRILKSENLIVTRPGRGGGSMVARPSAADVATSLDTFLHGWRLDTAVLMEAREVIEPWCAALAAKNRNDQDVKRLERHNQRMQDVLDQLPAYLAENFAWHSAVAEASHNELLATFIQAVRQAILRQTGDDAFNTIKVRETALRAHERVTEAIRDGDSSKAYRRMATHVHGFGEALLSSLGISEPGARSQASGG
jgi:GntR family transcriptional regulator, transcriptional repressor for pyruvate dehydrogenase complex